MRRLMIRGLAPLADAPARSPDRMIQSEQTVRLLSFSTDGRFLAGACQDSKVRIWDTASGKLQRAVPWNEADRRSLTLPPGAGLLATAGPDRVIRVWSLKDGELVHRLAGHTEPTGALAFSPDGRWLASSSAREQTVRLWDLASARQRFILPDGFGGASNLAFSPDGSILAGANYDTNLRVWSTRTGKLLRTIEELPVSMFALSFSPDGACLASAGVDRVVYLWNTRDWTVSRRLTGQAEMVSVMLFSPDGRVLATGGSDARSGANPVQVMLWDVASGAVLRAIPASHAVSSLAVSPDGKLVAVADRRNVVGLWSVPPPRSH